MAIEAVGTPGSFDTCQARLWGKGKGIANIGVHGKPVELHLEKLWDRNITTRLVDTVTIPLLLKVLQSGKLDAKNGDPPVRPLRRGKCL